MKVFRPRVDQAALRRLGVVAAVAAAHLGLLVVLSRSQAPPPVIVPPPIQVTLINPPAPPEPVPPPEPSLTAGGGAPAAPSRVHVPPPPVDQPVEVIAPIEQAPEPEIPVGVAPVATPEPGMGQGGQGTGTGTGVGAGSGPGSGGGPPRLLRGPSRQDLARAYPPEALRAGRSGRAVIACRIRLDTRLDGCRVVDENPREQGFGAAALRAAQAFRFRPPTTAAGRPVDGFEITLGVDFGA